MFARPPAPLVATLVCLFAPAALAAPIAVAEVKRDKPVDFETEILPILTRSCLACHNAKDAESDLVLESPQAIAKGGATGPTIVAGKGADSLLLKAAAHSAEPHMPPADNKVGAKNLTPDELGLLKLWIDQGAKGELRGGGPVQWQPLPAGVNPIYAIAVSSDNQLAACGRANQVFVYHLPSGRLLARLTDPALLSSGVYKQPGVAHLDLVQSLAFSPDGDLLASGGYREVKIWQRPRNVRQFELAAADPVRSIAASPDGKWLALGEASGKIELVDVASGKVARTLRGHTAAVTGVQFTADADKLLSSSEDKTIRAWKVGDGSPAGAIETPAAATALALLDNHSKMAVGGADHWIRLYDLPDTKNDPAQPQSGVKPLKELKGHAGPVTSLASASPDGKQLLSGSRDGSARLWAALEGREQRQFGHGAPVLAVAAAPNGQRFATAGENKSLKLWNAQNGQQVAELRGDIRAQQAVDRANREATLARGRLEDRKQQVPKAEQLAKSEAENVQRTTTAKTAAEKSLAEKTAAHKKALDEKQAADKAVADAKTAVEKAKAEIPTLDKRLADAKAAVDKAKAAQKAANESKSKDAADAKVAAEKTLADANKSLADIQQARNKAPQLVQQEENKLRQAEQKVKPAADALKKAENELQTAQSTLTAATKAVDAATAASKKAADAVPMAKAAVIDAEKVVAAADEAVKAAQKAAGEAEKTFRSLVFSADGALTLAGGESAAVHGFGAANGAAAELLLGHAAAVSALAALPNGSVASVADKQLIVWHATPPWNLVRTIGNADDAATLADRVLALHFSPDGKLLATGSGQPSRSGQLKLWNVADGTLAKDFPDAHSDTIFAVKFSPDGQYLATSAADRFMKVFDVAGGKLARSYEGHTHHVLGVAWKADGKLLATSGADSAIKIWDFTTGEQRRTITNSDKEIPCLTFLGDGDEIASCSGDRVVRIHGANDGGNRRNYIGPDDFLYAVATTVDGKLIVAGGQDGTLRVWSHGANQLLHAFETPKLPAVDSQQAAQAAK